MGQDTMEALDHLVKPAVLDRQDIMVALDQQGTMEGILGEDQASALHSVKEIKDLEDFRVIQVLQDQAANLVLLQAMVPLVLSVVEAALVDQEDMGLRLREAVVVANMGLLSLVKNLAVRI